MAVGAHDEQISFVLGCLRAKQLADRRLASLYFADACPDAVAVQRLEQSAGWQMLRATRYRFTDMAMLVDSQQLHIARPLQQRQRIKQGTRRLAGGVAGDHNALGRRRSRIVLRDHQNRPATLDREALREIQQGRKIPRWISLADNDEIRGSRPRRNDPGRIGPVGRDRTPVTVERLVGSYFFKQRLEVLAFLVDTPTGGSRAHPSQQAAETAA